MFGGGSMIPIYEQGSGKGIGHSLESFQKRFDRICADQLEDRRAKAFAFIFYDFTDQDMRGILKDEGVFAQLDRLSGRNLSLFYLHAGSHDAIERFNEHFMSVLEVEGRATLPCVVFFRVDGEMLEDVRVAQLESPDLIHGFRELYDVVESYINEAPYSRSRTNALHWITSGAKFISLEAFRAAIQRGVGLLW
jgi:hypothetical protein